MNDLKKFYDTVAACNRCGFCTSYCPTYNASGSESHSPRGRNQAFRALIEGRLSNPEKARDIIETCLLCGECTSVCFSEVPTADLMVQARHFLNEKRGIPKGLAFVLEKLLPHPDLFRVLLRLAFIGKKLGLAWLLQKSGLLRQWAPPLAAADHLVDKVPLRFLSDFSFVQPVLESTLQKKRQNVLAAQKKVDTLKTKGKPVDPALIQQAQTVIPYPKVALAPVCGGQYMRPTITVSTAKILRQLGLDLLIPDFVCCGLPGASYGVLERVQFFAKENIRRVEMAGFEAIVVDDSSCSTHFKDYPTYFENGDEWKKRAAAVSGKVQELSPFLLQKGLEPLLKKASWSGGPVAFHDPCKAQYGQRITEPPRQLLSAIPGVTVVPIFDSDQCCGGGGTFSFTHPEMSQDVLDSKVKHIMASGAQTVVTTSASCLIQVAFGLRKKNATIRVLHLTEFLAEALRL